MAEWGLFSPDFDSFGSKKRQDYTMNQNKTNATETSSSKNPQPSLPKYRQPRKVKEPLIL